jgi:hypothetical protein
MKSNRLRVIGLVVISASLATASCTTILGDGEYYVGSDAASPSPDGGADATIVHGDADASRIESTDAPNDDDACLVDCGVCSPGAMRCSGRFAYTCNDAGVWASPVECQFVCAGAGVCGACAVNSTQCQGNSIQLCDPTGNWQNSSSCPYSCAQAADAGAACAGKCVPGTTQCSGTESQTCLSSGAWMTTMTCPYACTGIGTCSGVCTPGAIQCSGSTPQTCDTTGTWQNQTACAQPLPDCQAGNCSCQETTCGSGSGSTCVNLQTDGQNCGACGHDCQGATCQSGVCQPTAIASSQSSPWGIAVDTTNVYWTNTGDSTVKMAPLSGAGPVTTLASGQSDPISIVVNGGNVYWASYARGMAGSGAVMTCAVGRCGSTLTPIATGQTGSWGVAVDGSGNTYFTAGSAVMKTPLVDGGPPFASDPRSNAYPVVVDNMNVYWGDSSGYVYKCAVGGCGGTPTSLSPSEGASPSYGIALDATYVYWSNESQGTIARVSKTGGGFGSVGSVLATGQSGPLGIAVNSGNIYWTNNTGGTVMSAAVPTGSGTVTAATVASGQSGPAGIAVDATYVYWANETAGTIMKVAK